MTANQIKTHLAQVFEQDYQGYDSFVKDVIDIIFTGEDAYEALSAPENIIDDTNRNAATRAGIKSVFKIGRIDAIEGIDVYDITLFDDKQLQYNRVGIQQLIRSQQMFYSTAFLLFHNEQPEGKEWRFSFFYKQGKIKDTTPAKRFTYLFGKNFRSRTASERFAQLADEEKSTQNLLNAFSVEALSKNFFNEYKGQYDIFCKFLFDHKNDTEYFGSEFTQWEDKFLRDYVKKMMGRITFIYFLQRKGWMNGNMEYMQKAFEQSPYQDNYLDAFLEPLFFGVLNTKPEERKTLFEKEGWALSLLDEWKDVPYLNGGLFERDEQDEPKSKFPAELFKGLFDFYSRYNFTIDENDPDDAEVGVDPEMLGHIFENLLEDNKDKGAFYTPKEIVQYMSQESIAQYLKTHTEEALHPAIDELIKEKKVNDLLQNKAVASAVYALLQEVKVCDPAIGSGAFPMGVLNVLYHARLLLYGFTKPTQEFSPSEVKREIIQNNIYGVDIEKGAIDIARLRFWLSIVVDSEQPEALPNFDYKFMQGNSLLEEFGGIDLSSLQNQVMQPADYEPQRDLFGNVEDSQMKMTFTQKETVDNLQANLEKYFNIDDHTKKQAVKEEISNSVKDHILYNINLRKERCLRIISDADVAISDEESQIEDIKARFPEDKMPVDEIRKHEKKISDLKRVIDRNNKKVYHYNSVSRELETIDLTSNESFFLWHTWFKDVFDNGGFDVVIGNPPYFVYEGYNTYELPTLRMQEDYEIAFGGKLNAYKLFLACSLKRLVKRNGINCYIIQNSFMADMQAANLRDYVLNNCQVITIDSYPERDSKKKRVFESVKMSVCILFVRNSESDSPFLVNIWDDKYKSSGISTHFTKEEIETIDSNYLTIPRLREDAKPIVLKMIATRAINIKCWEGELNITSHRQFFSTDSSLPIIMKGAGIQKYYYTFDMSQGQIEYLKEKEYLKKCGNSEKAHHHELDRIVMQGMTGANDKIRLIMSIVPVGMYLGHSCKYILPSDNISQKCLLAILNSKSANFFFRCFSTNSNVNAYEIEAIPIPSITTTKQKKIIALVDKILAAKKANPQADTREMEQQIDFLVYHLYGLTYEEVLIVDPETQITKEEYESK
ncbi:MAG: N-6 DNA methylase [Alphaproteobacteria bacterium]|nr:N-6 DNA methylase [Alphaproteobacteria bacterium]